MKTTRSIVVVLESATHAVDSTVEVPPYSTITTQGNTSVITENPATQTLPEETNPQLQDSSSQGENPQLQVVNAPLNTQAPEFHMSTIVFPFWKNPNPTYGMPYMPKLEEVDFHDKPVKATGLSIFVI